jgi:Type IV secretion system pilin
MLRKILNKSIYYFTFLQFLLYSLPARAQLLTSDGKEGVIENMKTTGKEAKFATTGDKSHFLLSDVMSVVIKSFLGLLGIIFLIMVLIGGYNWMTAAGDESKVEYGKKTLQRGIIGLIIIITAYSLTAFVFKAFSGTSGIIGNPS